MPHTTNARTEGRVRLRLKHRSSTGIAMADLSRKQDKMAIKDPDAGIYDIYAATE